MKHAVHLAFITAMMMNLFFTKIIIFLIMQLLLILNFMKAHHFQLQVTKKELFGCA